jgi:hypothetical protein
MEWMAKGALGVEQSMMTSFIMMFLFYLVWDRQRLDPLTNSISSLFGMCRRSAPIAPNGVQQQARNVPPVVQPPAPHPVVQHPAPPLQVNALPLQGPSSSSSRGATTPRIRAPSSRSGQASASSRNSGQASASSRNSGQARAYNHSYQPSASASYRNQGFSSSSSSRPSQSSSSSRPSSSSSSSKAPSTPRSHIIEAQRRSQLYGHNERTDAIDEIRLIIPELTYDEAADLYRLNLNPRFIKQTMNETELSYAEVLSEVLQIQGGRRTRKNKKQNRRRTRK